MYSWFRPLVSVLFTTVGFSHLGAEENWHASRLANLRHSDVALMPEGTPKDYELYRPLHPTVVAWGEDALPALDGGEKALAGLRRNTAAYRSLGVTGLATNVWMLTAAEQYLHRHPEFADTSCVDLWGEKIVPQWLADADYRGSKPWWGCTNNPRYVDFLLARMRAGLEAGATMVHLDDHSGTYACAAGGGGCFCEYCLAGFRAWLTTHIDPIARVEAGVADPAQFSYREFLQHQHYPDRTAFIQAGWKQRVPLWSWFLAFQRDASIRVIDRMEQEAARVAGHPMPFGVNAWNLEPKQLFDAHVVDYFANEVGQFDQEDLVPPVVYRLGEALGRPTFATGTGDDWVAYRQTQATTRVRGWIAEAYAFGQYFMYSWSKWGFSPKTGTLWTQVDPEVFRPMYDFVREHHDLFDGFENTATVGLLYDNATANRNHWAVRALSKALLDSGVSYRLIVSGDDILQRPLSADALNGISTLVIPDDVARTAAMEQILSDWGRHGGTVVNWSDPAPTHQTWRGQIVVTTVGRIWALPRVRRGVPGQPTQLVVHLLNRDYRSETDSFTPKHNIRIIFKPATFDGRSPVTHVRYFQPGAAPQELTATAGPDGQISVEVPDLNLWGILAF